MDHASSVLYKKKMGTLGLTEAGLLFSNSLLGMLAQHA